MVQKALKNKRLGTSKVDFLEKEVNIYKDYKGPNFWGSMFVSQEVASLKLTAILDLKWMVGNTILSFFEWPNFSGANC